MNNIDKLKAELKCKCLCIFILDNVFCTVYIILTFSFVKIL